MKHPFDVLGALTDPDVVSPPQMVLVGLCGTLLSATVVYTSGGMLSGSVTAIGTGVGVFLIGFVCFMVSWLMFLVGAVSYTRDG